MKYSTACILLLTAVATGSGCVRDFPEDDGKRITRHIAMHDEGAIARTRRGKPALIGPDGGLSIDGAAIPLDPAQRRLAKRYHDLTAALYADVLAMAGALDSPARESDVPASDDVVPATHAATPAVSPSDADHSLPARRLCERIGELEATQDALAEAVPAFKPHATLPASAGKLCMRGLAH